MPQDLEHRGGETFYHHHHHMTRLGRFLQKCAEHLPLYLAAYLTGYNRKSWLWMVGAAGLGTALELWRKERDFLMNAAKFVDEEKKIKDRLEDLPSWVVFPDFEKTEWLNKMVKSIWPNAAKHLEDCLRKSDLIGLKFEKIGLGAIPVRVGGVKVYDDGASNEIIVELDVCFAGESEFRIRYMGLMAGIKDLKIKGLLRCVMELKDASPFVGGIQVCFVTRPSVDFTTLGVASLGLASEIRRILNEKIESSMVFPEKINLHFSDMDTEDTETVVIHEPAILVTDPEKVDAIRQRESDITQEMIQKVLATGANVILATGGIDDLCPKILVKDPEKLDAIRQRGSDITKETIQKVLATGANVILATGGIDDLCPKVMVEGAEEVCPQEQVKSKPASPVPSPTKTSVFLRNRLHVHEAEDAPSSLRRAKTTSDLE